MTTRKRVAATWLLPAVFLLLPSVLVRLPSVFVLAQSRDAVVAPPGSAVVEGIVVTDDADHRPVHRAIVMLASGAFGIPQSVVTDDAGAFVFIGVVAGNYTLEATKPAYVPTFYGAKRAGSGPGVPVAVVERQHVTGLVLRMPHGSVLTGALRYANGKPASGVDVQVTPVQVVNAERRPGMDLKNAMTDDRGVYRVFGLAAGDYVVMARPRAFMPGALGSNDTRQVTAEEVQWALQAVGPGQRIGLPPALGLPPAPGQTVAYAPVYYPGTSDPSNAAVITIGVAEERRGLDFVLAAVPTARITGLVVGADGGPASGGRVTIASLQPDAADVFGSVMSRISGQPSPDGTFSLNGVLPGRYRITARAAPPAASGKSETAAPNPLLFAQLAAMGGGPDAAATLWGQEEVMVDGHDISGISIRLQAGLTVSGKVVLETSAPADLTQVRISADMPVKGNGPGEVVAALLGGSSSSIESDGTFSIKGLTPDRYRLGVATGGLRGLLSMMQPGAPDSAPGTLFLKTAMWNGRDVVDTPFDLRPGVDASGMVVTLTDRPTILSGTVRDGAGRPTPNYPIVVFSTDRASWFAGSRRIQQAHVASDGTFTITGLPAGEYFVAALTDLNANELYEPAFLESITATSLRLTLLAGEKKTQDLKLAGGGGV
jgi:hypothetical protein